MTPGKTKSSAFACLPVLLLVVALVWPFGAARGQTATGQVNGVVNDPSGAAVPGAEVVLTNAGTNIEDRATSNESGYFTFRNLQPGRYRLKVAATGFKTATLADFPIVVNQVVTKDVALALGEVSESVEVVAGAEMLQQASSELGEVVTQEAVRGLPLNGRNFTQLMTLTPGATPVSTAQGSGIETGDGGNTGVPGSTFIKPSFNGQQNRSYIIYQDGIINMDFRSHGYATLPNVDLLQEFKVQSHNEKVEWGGVTGGIVNLVSKSGTNQFHGSGFWFVRNNVFDARNPFTDATRDSPPPFRQNQFGATFAGRIIRNKTFFSGGFEGWRYRKPTQSQGRVPTDKELSGDFSDSIIGQNIFDPFSTTRDADGNYVRTQFPNNRIPQSLISAQMQGFLQQYGERPNYVHPTFNFINSVSARDDSESFQIKIDHQFSEKDSIFGRWTYLSRDSVVPNGEKSTGGSETRAHNFGGGWLHMFGANLIMNIRGGVARRDITGFSQHVAGLEALKTLGFRDVDRFQGLIASLTSPWGSFGFAGPSPRENPTFNAAGDLTWVRGSHSLKFGGQWLAVERLQGNTSQTFRFADTVTGNPQKPGTTGASLASALLGLPSSFDGYLPEDGLIHFRVSTYSGYVQDEWRVSPRLTMNFGVRLDHNRPGHVLSDGLMAGLDIDRGVWIIGTESMPPPCNQAGKAPCIPGSGLQDVLYGDRIVLADTPNFLPANIWDNWGPRFGLAYRLDDKTVLRGGYGLYWDTLNSNSQYTQHNVNQWPKTTGFSGKANDVGQPIQYLKDLEGNFPAVLPQSAPWNQDTWTNDPDRKNGYSQQWNIEIQREMSEGLMAAVAYVGSVNGRGEYSGLGNTALTPGRGTPEEVNARRPMPIAGGGFFYSRSIGESNYNALQAKLRRRFTNGFETLLSYTWSKSMDNGSSGWFAAENGPGGGAAAQNYHYPDSNRSVSSYDVTHFLSWFSVYELPFGRNKHYLTTGPAAWILGGWQLNNILQWRSGQPYNLEVPGDVANVGNTVGWYNYARPNLVGNPYIGNPTVDRYFNTDAFAVPDFAYGNFGRNVLRSDRVFNMDLSLFKQFPIAETKRLELRFEAFNVFNHIDWSTPGTLVSRAGAGQITAVAHAPRILQMGLKFEF
ncbi:MAG: carboxypeptidase regulatory-like domain-containing protein [Bryobacteraceae bacterium]|nr:carboxypeptidase regulatory-like domain-containing protein [Bryobacteraceae bacterium]